MRYDFLNNHEQQLSPCARGFNGILDRLIAAVSVVQGDGLLSKVRKAKNAVTHTAHKAVGKVSKKLRADQKCRVHLKVSTGKEGHMS